MTGQEVDLGHGHTYHLTRWAPDRELNPQFAHLPDVEAWGATVSHLNDAGEPCRSGVTFDGPVQCELVPDHARWELVSLEPLTLSPSLLCRAPGCTDHGFIREGRWVPVCLIR